MLRHRGKARKTKRHSTAQTPCAYRYWENKQKAMLKHYLLGLYSFSKVSSVVLKDTFTPNCTLL